MLRYKSNNSGYANRCAFLLEKLSDNVEKVKTGCDKHQIKKC